jgi:hypothetical protein
MRAYLRELDQFRGRPRVWVVFAHSLPRLEEQPTLRSYLGSIGVRREAFEPAGDDPFAVTAELYDLSLADRLETTSADVYPVPPSDEAFARYVGCDFGPHVAARGGDGRPRQ